MSLSLGVLLADDYTSAELMELGMLAEESPASVQAPTSNAPRITTRRARV